MILREFPAVNYGKAEKLIKGIKGELKIMSVDRSKEIVVGTAIYLRFFTSKDK